MWPPVVQMLRPSLELLEVMRCVEPVLRCDIAHMPLAEKVCKCHEPVNILDVLTCL